MGAGVTRAEYADVGVHIHGVAEIPVDHQCADGNIRQRACRCRWRWSSARVRSRELWERKTTVAPVYRGRDASARSRQDRTGGCPRGARAAKGAPGIRRRSMSRTPAAMAQRHAMESAMLAGRRRLRQRPAHPRHKLRVRTASVPGRATSATLLPAAEGGSRGNSSSIPGRALPDGLRVSCGAPPGRAHPARRRIASL